MPTLQVANAEIYFETHGEKGPWITLINGHTRSSKDFKLLARNLVDAGFQCLIFDNRGSGSTKVHGDFTARDMVNDVYALWEKIGIRSCFVAGISMGGMLSEIIASERDLHGLVLISTSAGQHNLNPISFGEWGTTLESVAERMSYYFPPSFAVRNKLLIDAMNKQILNAVLNEGFGEKAKAQRKAVEGIDNRLVLEKIKCPTLIIHGSEDRIIEAEVAYELENLIPKAELKLIEGAGHLLLAEDSKGLAKSIISFCQTHRA